MTQCVRKSVFGLSLIFTVLKNGTQREKYPYLEFSWSVFSRSRTEIGPEKSEYGEFPRSATCVMTSIFFFFFCEAYW